MSVTQVTTARAGLRAPLSLTPASRSYTFTDSGGRAASQWSRRLHRGVIAAARRNAAAPGGPVRVRHGGAGRAFWQGLPEGRDPLLEARARAADRAMAGGPGRSGRGRGNWARPGKLLGGLCRRCLLLQPTRASCIADVTGRPFLLRAS